MIEDTNVIGWIIGLPLLGAILNGFLGAVPWKKFPRLPGSVAGILASACVFVAFIISCVLFFTLPEGKIYEHFLFPWISIGELVVPMLFRFDQLSGLLCLIITGVGFLIHVYSIGYMHGDSNPQRYFSYLNLFTAAMLVLVLGGNLPILFIGWEGVGLCSFLLIGFWYEDVEKAKAGKKAFIINRIGDLGFLLGVFLIFSIFHTVDFLTLKSMTAEIPIEPTLGLLTAVTLLLFVGAVGKSAQVPLFVWLPDAMAGPTPVSALIHAATMVTAGVYLTCRLGFLYSLTPITGYVIVVVGALTAFMAATMAIAQSDIKKVLAYSTVSQLGYMFVAVGVGAYWVAVFHLMTHAFFKALLFLGSGSVIHAMGGEQDMRKMGGLHKHMPITSVTFAIGTLAIAGVPLFSGFFSKDEILWQAFGSPLGGWVLYVFGLLTAALTALYMGRLYCLTFLGENRSSKEVQSHLQESPRVMTIPLIVLAVFATLGGFLGFPHFIGLFPNYLHHLLVPIVPDSLAHGSALVESLLLLLSAVLACLCLYASYWYFIIYMGEQKKAPLFHFSPSVVSFFQRAYYLNELYAMVITRPVHQASTILWRVVDTMIIDGFVLYSARAARSSGGFLKRIHTGLLENYLFIVILGFVSLASIVLWTLAGGQ